jgi:hypothetical protein
VIVAVPGKAVNTSLFGTSRNSKLKIPRREAMQLINQLANNLEVQDREMF